MGVRDAPAAAPHRRGGASMPPKLAFASAGRWDAAMVRSQRTCEVFGD